MTNSLRRYKIEKNIPVTEKYGKASRYPLDEMAPPTKNGPVDSFLVPFGDLPRDGEFSAPYTQASKLGIKISVRKEAKGYRIWRVE